MSRTILLFFYLLPSLAGAAGVGQIADNLMAPVFVLTNIIGSVSMALGVSFLLAAFLRYLQYRVNPMAVPLSTVILLLVMGAILACLPMAYKLTESGIPMML